MRFNVFTSFIVEGISHTHVKNMGLILGMPFTR
jgi:hypothetical protein